jgi:hypothetical protein
MSQGLPKVQGKAERVNLVAPHALRVEGEDAQAKGKEYQGDQQNQITTLGDRRH